MVTEVRARSPEEVQIVEVGIRDGLQNYPRIVSTADKLQLLSTMIAGGLRHIEAGSFVREDRLPEMANSDRVFQAAVQRWPQHELIALVPNVRGAVRAMDAGARSLRMVVSASEGHSEANTGRSVARGLQEAEAVLRCASDRGEVMVAVGVSTAFVCPFDGVIDPSRVVEIVGTLAGCGYRSISLADTLGRANPSQIATTLSAVKASVSEVELNLHLHNTYGMALANALTALDAGVRSFDAAIGGLGGCPFAPGALGNLATEELILLLDDLGYHSGVSLKAIGSIVKKCFRILGSQPQSSVSKAMGWITPDLRYRADDVGYSGRHRRGPAVPR